MKEKIKVPGVLLSGLFYDLVNSFTDEEGLIFGHAMETKEHAIQDDPHAQDEATCTYVVHHFEIVGGSFSFYDEMGNINEDKLKQLLIQSKQTLLGWFRFRRNMTALKPSIRDETVHENLEKTLKQQNGFIAYSSSSTLSSSLLFGLFNATADENGSTHTHDYCFMHQGDKRTGNFQKVFVEISNLVETTRLEYRNSHHNFSYSSDGAFGKIKASLGEIQQTELIKRFEMVNRAILDDLQGFVSEVVKSDHEVENLKKEILDLRTRIHQKKNEAQIEIDPTKIGSKRKNSEETETQREPEIQEKTLIDVD